MIQNYEDLEVYQKSYTLAVEIYERSKEMPKEETYGLISQIRRAALSIPLNIAEGYGKRESAAEFKRFLSMGKGSCDEMKVLIDFCKDVNIFNDESHCKLKVKYDEIGKMLYSLMQRWK